MFDVVWVRIVSASLAGTGVSVKSMAVIDRWSAAPTWLERAKTKPMAARLGNTASLAVRTTQRNHRELLKNGEKVGIVSSGFDTALALRAR
jgi:hypothetical protein